MNVKGLTQARGFCPAIEGIGALDIDNDGNVLIPAGLPDKTVKEIKKQILANFPGAIPDKEDA